jgi:hypothetical protein
MNKQELRYHLPVITLLVVSFIAVACLVITLANAEAKTPIRYTADTIETHKILWDTASKK